MKKLLILVLIALLVTLCIFIVMNGVTIGKIEILGIQDIQQRNAQLDEKIQEAGKLANKDYQQTVNSVKDNAKKLEDEKKNYEDMTSISTDGEIQTANQIEKYEIETLWVKLGNHATKEGAVMKMNVEKGSNTAAEIYDLRFTVNGSYIAIEEFISNIENDSSLGFKIEEFKMIPSGSGEELQATFVCKNIAIKDVSETPIATPTEDINDTNTANGTKNTNSANATNVTKNTNTTNTNVAK